MPSYGMVRGLAYAITFGAFVAVLLTHFRCIGHFLYMPWLPCRDRQWLRCWGWGQWWALFLTAVLYAMWPWWFTILSQTVGHYLLAGFVLVTAFPCLQAIVRHRFWGRVAGTWLAALILSAYAMALTGALWGLPFFFDYAADFSHPHLMVLPQPLAQPGTMPQFTYVICCLVLLFSLTLVQAMAYDYGKWENRQEQLYLWVGLRILPLLLLVFYAALWYQTSQWEGFVYTVAHTDLPSAPWLKAVLLIPGAWAVHAPWGLGLGAACLTVGFFWLRWAVRASIPRLFALRRAADCLGIGLGISLWAAWYPFLCRSTCKAGHSLTLWDASRSQQDLLLAVVASLIIAALACWIAYRALVRQP